MRRCEQGVHCAGRCRRAENGRVTADRIEHREQVGGPCFEIRGRDIASGGATSASVVEDQPSELRELAQERAPVGFVPNEVDVPREGMEVHGEIDWARPDHLIGDIGAVRSLCVAGLIRHEYTDFGALARSGVDSRAVRRGSRLHIRASLVESLRVIVAVGAQGTFPHTGATQAPIAWSPIEHRPAVGRRSALARRSPAPAVQGARVLSE